MAKNYVGLRTGAVGYRLVTPAVAAGSADHAKAAAAPSAASIRLTLPRPSRLTEEQYGRWLLTGEMPTTPPPAPDLAERIRASRAGEAASLLTTFRAKTAAQPLATGAGSTVPKPPSLTERLLTRAREEGNRLLRR